MIESPKDINKQIGGDDDSLKEKLIHESMQNAIQTVSDELAKQWSENATTFTDNMRSFAIANTNWKEIGEKVTSHINDKINLMLENIEFAIISTDDNKYETDPNLQRPELPEQNFIDNNNVLDEENKEEDQVDIEPLAEPLAEPVDATVDATGPVDATVDATGPVADNNTLKVDTNNPQQGGGELPPDILGAPALDGYETQNGGTKKDNKKRQTIRVKYLSKNKTRKNLI